MPTAFNLLFWKAAVGAATTSSVILVAIAIFTSGSNPPKPVFPFWHGSYVSAYYRNEDFDHYFFRFGLFGFGDRIQNADVLILGSSHAMFGISADRVSAVLSERQGRPVTAFNMAMGHGEGAGFAQEILEAHKARGRTLLLDLHSNEQGLPSDAARRVLRADILGAYVAVAAPTAEFLRDWLFDGFLPRISSDFGEGVRVDRFLQSIIIRRRNTGDLDDIWAPEQGSLFRRASGRLISKLPLYPPQLKGAHPTLRPEYGAYLTSVDDRVALTLIPYDGYRLDEAKRVADRIRKPFLEIDPSDLQTLDGSHLSAASRDIASLRLIDRLSELTAR